MTPQSETPERVFLGMGSNLGDRLHYLRSGITRLMRSGLIVERASSVYESEAHSLDSVAQPDYLNIVIEIQSSRTPEDLLHTILEIEASLGRVRESDTRWQNRTMDIDILLYGDRTIQDRHLSVPHPRLADRRFVLQPLAEIAPDVVVPLTRGATVNDLLQRCTDTGAIHKVYPPSILFTNSNEGIH